MVKKTAVAPKLNKQGILPQFTTKKTAVAPLKKKEPKLQTLWVGFNLDEDYADVLDDYQDAKYYPYYIKLIVPVKPKRPNVDLGTITLPE